MNDDENNNNDDDNLVLWSINCKGQEKINEKWVNSF